MKPGSKLWVLSFQDTEAIEVWRGLKEACEAHGLSYWSFYKLKSDKPEGPIIYKGVTFRRVLFRTRHDAKQESDT